MTFTAFEAVPPSRLLGPPVPADSHAALLSTERSTIETYLVAVCRSGSFDPFDMFVVVIDLRGGFGRRLGLHMLDRVTLDRRIRRALADGALPSLSIPVGLDQGITLVELVAPEWIPSLDKRPPL